MNLERILISSIRKRGDKYQKLVDEIKYYIEDQKKLEIMEMLDSILNIEKEILVKKNSMYKQQIQNVRNNEEYDYLDKLIKLSDFIIKKIL